MKPSITAAFGGRGTGKSAWVKQQLREQLRPTRLAVWDLMQEHVTEQRTDSLGDAIRLMAPARFSVAFLPSRDDAERARQFAIWCRAVMIAGRCTAVVEELAFVTRPSWAPAAWREMVLLGRHPPHLVSIVGTSQRPAQVDKDFVGNADHMHCGRLRYRSDAKAMAEVLDVDYRELLRLPDLEFFDRPNGALNFSRGRLEFAGRPETRPAPFRAPIEPDSMGRSKQARTKAATLPRPFDLADLAATPEDHDSREPVEAGDGRRRDLRDL